MVQNSVSCRVFQNSLPQKATCSCSVGASGLCCHILALLSFLKHYAETDKSAVTEWHRRSKKRSIATIPFKQIKPKSTGVKIKQIKVDISPADPQNSYFKRDLLNIILNLKKKVKKIESN